MHRVNVTYFDGKEVAYTRANKQDAEEFAAYMLKNPNVVKTLYLGPEK